MGYRQGKKETGKKKRGKRNDLANLHPLPTHLAIAIPHDCRMVRIPAMEPAPRNGPALSQTGTPMRRKLRVEWDCGRGHSHRWRWTSILCYALFGKVGTE